MKSTRDRSKKEDWSSINTKPEVFSPFTLQLHYFLFPVLAIKNYKKRNKGVGERQKERENEITVHLQQVRLQVEETGRENYMNIPTIYYL